MKIRNVIKTLTAVSVVITLASCGVKKEVILLSDSNFIEMIQLKDANFNICSTEIPQGVYAEVMGENPSDNKGDSLPAERVSYYDSICFCNKLSIRLGKKPVYSVNGETDPSKWNYEEVAWTDANSKNKSREVKSLKANNFGIYDMSGNVHEWIYMVADDTNRFFCGGCFFEGSDMATPEKKYYTYTSSQKKTVEFRIVATKA